MDNLKELKDKNLINLNSFQNIYGILGNKYILINKIGKG
jgi:hypothetical protein